jgi:hypothetical protein
MGPIFLRIGYSCRKRFMDNQGNDHSHVFWSRLSVEPMTNDTLKYFIAVVWVSLLHDAYCAHCAWCCLLFLRVFRLLSRVLLCERLLFLLILSMCFSAIQCCSCIHTSHCLTYITLGAYMVCDETHQMNQTPIVFKMELFLRDRSFLVPRIVLKL